MKSLVLGGSGFIGSHLVDRLKLAGRRVSVFDRNPELYRKPCPDVRYHYGEFGNRGLLGDALTGIDVVFHLISTTLPKTSNDDPAFDVQSNVIETIYLLEKCLEKGVGKVVFISSGGTVYGEPLSLPVSEESPTNPACSYGITKLTIEKYLSLFNQLHGLDYVVVRPSNPYGERQNPCGIQGAIPVFLSKVAKGEPIVIWGDGEVVRDYIYIADLVEGVYRAAISDSDKRIFNIGSGEGHSLNELVDIARTITERPVAVSYQGKRSFDIPAIYLDISRARRELSWAPATELEEGMRRTWEFVRSVS